MIKIIKQAFTIAIVLQLFISSSFFLSSVIMKKGQYYVEYGLYAAYLSIQFFPFLFIILVIVFSIFSKVKKASN